MNTVTATIDISKPTGRRIVRELDTYKKVVRLDYIFPEEISGQTYTFEEVFRKAEKRLNEHYGSSCHLDL